MNSGTPSARGYTSSRPEESRTAVMKELQGPGEGVWRALKTDHHEGEAGWVGKGSLHQGQPDWISVSDLPPTHWWPWVSPLTPLSLSFPRILWGLHEYNACEYAQHSAWLRKDGVEWNFVHCDEETWDQDPVFWCLNSDPSAFPPVLEAKPSVPPFGPNNESLYTWCLPWPRAPHSIQRCRDSSEHRFLGWPQLHTSSFPISIPPSRFHIPGTIAECICREFLMAGWVPQGLLCIPYNDIH